MEAMPADYPVKMSKMHKEINNINKKLRQVIDYFEIYPYLVDVVNNLQVFTSINQEISNMKINVRYMILRIMEILEKDTGVKLIENFIE